MPIYTYKCNKCNFCIEENMKVEDRDNIEMISKKYCPERYETIITDGKVIMVEVNADKCEMKRAIDKTTFKI